MWRGVQYTSHPRTNAAIIRYKVLQMVVALDEASAAHPQLRLIIVQDHLRITAIVQHLLRSAVVAR